MASQTVAGLCWLPRGTDLYQQVPLYNVRIDATLWDLSAQIKVHQTYVNNLLDEYGPLECAYIYPLDEGSAVSAFAVQLDGVVIQGRIIETMDGRLQAQDNNSTLSTLNLSQFSGNIFHCKIGTLNPGSICTITLTYFTPLEQVDRHNRLTLPMSIAPPAIPGPLTPLTSPEPASTPHNIILKGYYCNHCLCTPIIGTRHPCTTCAQQQLCHPCHMQPDMSHPMLAHAQPNTPARSKLGNLSILLNITMPSPIISIQCPSHPMDIKIERTSNTSNHATASFHSNSTPSLSTDFILLVEQQRCFEPRILCELDMANQTAAVSLVFIPPPLDMLSASQIRCELIFLLDCSGSMQGSSITCVRECMQIVLRSLPVNGRFNILVFGSTWSSLFPTCRSYDDESLSEASKYVSKLRAELGGTEIYAPLLHALTTDLLPAHPRQVFLLTDGQVNNVEQLVQLASQHAVTTRLSTFGIGGSVDRSLCKKLAQAGRGKCEFITAEDGGGSVMRKKVVRQVTKALQPMLTDVKVDWGQLIKAGSTTSTQAASSEKSSASSFLQCPSVAPAINCMTSRYVLYALNVSLPQVVWQKAQASQKVDFKCKVIITAYSNYPLEADHMHHSVMLTGEQITQAQVIHTLAAKERVRELEDKLVLSSAGKGRKRMEDEILQMAMKHSLSSSFVLVHNPGTDKEMVKDMASFIYYQAEDQQHTNQNVPARAEAQSDSSTQNQLPNPSGGLINVTGPQTGTQMLHVGNIGSQLLLGGECAWLGRVQPWCALCGSARTGDLLRIEQLSRANIPTGLLFGGVQQPWGKTECASGTVIKDSTTSSELSGNSQFSSQTDAKLRTAFEDLIQLQSANGMWPITPTLINSVHAIVPSSCLTVTMKSLEAINKKHGVEGAIVGVIMALHLLETNYKNRYAEWEMLATKAQYYVAQHGKVSTDLQQEIKGSVAKLLST